MRIHPLLITAFVTVSIFAVVTGVRRHQQTGERAAAVNRITASMTVLTGALRDASAGPSEDSLNSIASIAEQTTDSFRALAVDATDQDGVLQRAYTLFRSAEREARIRMLFDSATMEILKYDADADLQGITPKSDSRGIMQRMYLAKGGLQASRAKLKQAFEFGSYTVPLTELSDRLGVLSESVDRVIMSTDNKSYDAADVALAQYRAEMNKLKAMVRATSELLYSGTVFSSLATDADSLMSRLVEITR